MTIVASSDHSSGYEAYYGLVAHPFSLTPDLRFVYPSRSHSHAFNEVTDALKRREGLIVVTGDIGTGKTVLCRTLLETFDARTFLSVILDPHLGVDDLVHQVLSDFGLVPRTDPGRRPSYVDRHQLVSTLQRFLATLVPVGAHAVIMVDEAQQLDPSVLEELRLLSNFETTEAKLLQIVLVGQPDLDRVLQRPDMQQLNQRITRRVALHPLAPDEVEDYVERRLVVAMDIGNRSGGELHADRVTFTSDAVKAIADISRGIPRVINTVGNQALEVGFERQTQAIDRGAVLEAARRLKLAAPMPLKRIGATGLRVAAALALVTGALGAWWLWSTGRSRSAEPARAAAPVVERTTKPTSTASEAPRSQPSPPRAAQTAPAPPAAQSAPAPPMPATAGNTAPAARDTGAYEISVAAFRTAQRAEEVADAIAQRGFPVSTRADAAGTWHRIVVGPLISSDEAESVQRALARQGFSGTKITASAREGR